MQLLGMLFAPIFRGMPGLLPLLSSTMVSLSLHLGMHPHRRWGMDSWYGVMCLFGRGETGYSFGTISTELAGSVQCAGIQVYNSAFVWGLYSASAGSSEGSDTNG